ncbi:hypothetical protein GCM10027062_44030 [Nocardioides hungaricus]
MEGPDWDPNGQWSEDDDGTPQAQRGSARRPAPAPHTVASEVRHGRQNKAIRDENDWQFP